MVTEKQIRDLMEREEYIRNEYRRAVPIMKQIGSILSHATGEVGGSAFEMGYKEHESLIEAWRSGLSWFLNHEGGPWLQEVYLAYLRTLKREGYEGDIFREEYKEQGIE